MGDFNCHVIQKEPPQKCELCGNVSELRPYGKNGEFICFNCGMKDEEITSERMEKVMSASYKTGGNA